MADLLLDLTALLVTEGVVTCDGIDCFRDFTPNEPNDIVVLNEYAGVPSETCSAAVRSIQVISRGVNASTAKQRIWDIYKLLNTPENRLMTLGDRWLIVLPRQTPFRIDVDKNNRIIWGFNVAITTVSD